MTPLKLEVRPAALADLERRVTYLTARRGTVFARDWKDRLLDWLTRTAENGAVLGTRAERRPDARTFRYRGQATILAEFTETDLRILRVYFTGQDWRA